MKTSQANRILELLHESTGRVVTCGELASRGLFHKGASRISELRKEGYVIEFVPGETWDKAYYHMMYDPVLDKEQLRIA